MPPARDRALGFWVSQVLYAGRILAGATLLDHLEVFGELRGSGDPLSLFLVRRAHLVGPEERRVSPSVTHRA